MKYIVGISGTEISQKDLKLLKNPQVGGVILYLNNTTFNNKEDLKAFIQLIRKEANREILIAIDEEGGFVSRLFRFLPEPSPYYLSTLYKQGKEKKVRKYIEQKSELLNYLGIDINLAPVVDYTESIEADKYGRFFGYGDKELIIRMTKLWIEEHKKYGIRCCIKHFPGIGRSSVDSHEDLPTINITKGDWEKTEKRIFQELIKDTGVDVMVGHVKYTNIYPNAITSISDNWLTDLKSIIGESGSKLWMDSLNMNAIKTEVENGIVNKKLLTDLGYEYCIIKDPYEENIKDLVLQ